jgi:hypothetical protein
VFFDRLDLTLMMLLCVFYASLWYGLYIVEGAAQLAAAAADASG